eukprot:TRINITY_DN26297_c0_g1_i2.p3 TRINITY_DN26297_c0_g1~~TRINITY_DN26297_c0_g1_i2.p3  ORF type:complete len:110 (+),score=28.26 TRINITY_DN26297_c0_g1_i2:76-405(+)
MCIRDRDKMVKITEENQQTTSKAFTELFMYVEDIRKKYEDLVIELRKEIVEIKIRSNRQGRPVNLEGRILDTGEPVADIPFIKRMELSLIHICRCRRIERCRSRWSPYH